MEGYSASIVVMRNYPFVFYYLWVAPHVLLGAVAGLMYRRRLQKTFPIFFTYILFEIFEFALLFTCYLVGNGLGAVYRYAYISTLALSTALRFGIIQEIFDNVFADYSNLEKLATLVMRIVTVVLIVAATVLALYNQGSVSSSVIAGVRLLERSVTVIQVGLLLFLFIFSRMFGISWRSYTFGVAFGFAVFASAQLAEWTISLLNLGEAAKNQLDLLATGSYHVCVLIWLVYLLTAEKAVSTGVYAVPDLERWSGELERSQ